MTRKYDEALQNFQNCYRISHKIGDRYNESMSLGNMGNVFFELKDFKKARNFFFKALRLRKRARDVIGMVMTYHNIGNSYNDENRFNLAIKYYEISLKQSIEHDIKEGILYNSQMLSEVYFRLRKYAKSRIMLQLALELNSKLNIAVFKERIKRLRNQLDRL